MSSNKSAVRADLAPGHFLFTSESVGEGHPGTCRVLCSPLVLALKLIYVQIKFAIKCPMPL